MSSPHTFHIPVMGLGFTVDSPIKVAQFGISSVVSIMDDHLLEDMRRYYSRTYQIPYLPIDEGSEDYRAKRVTAYLNLLQEVVDQQVEVLKQADFESSREINQYFQLLPEQHPATELYQQMMNSEGKQGQVLQEKLREYIQPGQIDVNIMTKVDKINYNKAGEALPREYSDALSALRGFAKSKAKGSVVFSAGLNPALFAYAEQFEDFFPDQNGQIKKGIILKVSDYRSALIQGRFLAKKGLWVSEFRIESGLNCGGHAFATDGLLVGPILEDFKNNRAELAQTLLTGCQQVWKEKGYTSIAAQAVPKITYQGGIGNAEENAFLLKHYKLDGTGWGSPFLLVPEATSVDEDTLQRLLKAKKSDFYLSHASPLGVPFNNLRISSGEDQRKARIAKNRPGSPCYKKFLTFSTEFSEKPICTASREYQHLKLKQLDRGEVGEQEVNEILEKDCLCEGLSAPALLSAGEQPRRNLNAVTICPGPNLAYFKGTFTLKEMVDHIYGKIQLQLDPDRPHVFIKELQLYVQHLQKEIEKSLPEQTAKYVSYIDKFKTNLNDGINYYQDLVQRVNLDANHVLEQMKVQLKTLQEEVQGMVPTVS
ncbi:hypothetical protein [Cecembia lonarensis]|uniref:Uncharacterized protein n=1 Tax=Cecembia lonarensis (strain CCUG 58316 / KCTC 22772 / LW9) TaxID=1225176 RepID=K1L0K5_CECL9|nr:hypothetical protein [Cecembia lonarensis]EKB49945.1 hypothetical protein B879_01370 [Cecembia lonarensis LW9]